MIVVLIAILVKVIVVQILDQEIFWGNRYKKNNKGVSAVFVLTERGDKLFNEIKLDVTFEEISEVNECLNYQHSHSYNNHIRNIAFNSLQNNSLKSTIKKYRSYMPKKYLVKSKLKTIISYLPYQIKDFVRGLL